MINMYIVFVFLCLFGFWSEVSALADQRIFANRGSTLIIPCKLPRFDNSRYKVTWSSNVGNYNITFDQQAPGSAYSVIHEGLEWNLKIEDLQLNNDGEYICFLNTTPSVTQITQLEVQDTNLDTKRIFQAKERENVRIECPVTVPLDNYWKWYKGGKEVKYSNNGPILLMYNVSKNDSGDFSCEEISTHNEYSGRFTLRVKAVPPTNITGVRGSTVVLPCNFRSIDLRTFKVLWFRGKKSNQTMISIGNMMFTNSKRYSIIRNQAHTWNLQIDDLKPTDSGEFTCQVNAGPPVRKIVNLRVQELKNPIQNITAFQGSTVVLPCFYNTNVNNIDGRHLLVVWFDNNMRPVTFNQRSFRSGYTILRPHDWNLKLTNVEPSDTGSFSCSLVSENSVRLKNKTVILNVGGPPKFENSFPLETMVTEGESLTLTCRTSGSPQPSVKWYEYIDRFEKRIVYEGQQLTLPHVTRYDAATFECIAEHSFPPAVSMKTDVKVQFAPEIQSLEERLEAEKGSETILKCDVTSYPQAAVMWIRNGKAIFNSLKYRINVTEEKEYTKQLTLTIKNIEESDFGSYVCEARNKVDKTQESIEVSGDLV